MLICEHITASITIMYSSNAYNALICYRATQHVQVPTANSSSHTFAASTKRTEHAAFALQKREMQMHKQKSAHSYIVSDQANLGLRVDMALGLQQ